MLEDNLRENTEKTIPFFTPGGDLTAKKSRQISHVDLGRGVTIVEKVSPSYSKTTSTKIWPIVPGTQVTESENHPNWFGNRLRGDVGGEFFSQKRFMVRKGQDASVKRLGYDVGSGIIENYFYNGPVYPFAPDADLSGGWMTNTGQASNSQLDKLGATAIARTMPTNAVINLTVFLGEILREGIPRAKFKLWEERSKEFLDLRKRVGEDYLNVQFGWAPLMRDLKSSYDQIANAEGVIQQYERDAGRVVRRHYVFPVERSITYGSWTDLAAPYYGPRQTRLENPGNSHKVVISDELEIHRWFSGAYVYYLPSDWKSRQRMMGARDELSKLFDISLTPEAVWNLTPWSWAVDWFANTGDVLHNISSFADHSLVLKYGYMMQHSIAKRTYNCVDPKVFYDGSGQPYQVEFVVETKQRRRATPYGFGFDMSALSASQAAILSALGLTKSK